MSTFGARKPDHVELQGRPPENIRRIDDAHRILRLLSGEQEWYAAEENHRGIEALHKLRSIAPRVRR